MSGKLRRPRAHKVHVTMALKYVSKYQGSVALFTAFTCLFFFVSSLGKIKIQAVTMIRIKIVHGQFEFSYLIFKMQ